uniref:Uncharacterized protein n=1 Tax=Siphoviridae sp. ctXoo4 TaxID=2826372 RepID=A0A8S5MA45_9CAUD|nr:MAG TPA: hypothetical protein [Siphoviridae sp. ctXoo4]
MRDCWCGRRTGPNPPSGIRALLYNLLQRI